MVEVGETVIELPVPADVPPQEPVNHSTPAPEPPETVSVVLVPLQIVVVPVTPVGAVGPAETFTVVLAQLVVFAQLVPPVLLT